MIMKSLHNFNGKGKSLFLIIMMAALLAPARMMGQETLTIYADGGDTQKAFIPFYGNYVNYYQKNEFIIPASKIVTMEDGVISKMTFYCTYSSSFDFACTFQVFMKEVSQSEFSNTSFLGTSGASVVYEGPLSRSSGPLEIDFTNAFAYHGGNLLIGFYVTETSSNKTTNYFYGETVTNSSLHGRNASSLDNITSGEHENFLPMVTFEYTMTGCVRPHYLEAKSVSSSAALLTWEPGSLDQDLWEIYYTTTANDVPDENTTATISNITSPRRLIEGLTENTKYYVYVRAVCGGEDGNSRWSDVCSFTAQDTHNLTICDGTATSQYVPFNFYNQHQYQKCEYIIPASKVGVMNGSIISSMSFYDNVSGNGYTNTTFTIWLKEVDIETFPNSYFIGTADATQVYQGTLRKTNNAWTVTFTEPYHYSGRNLLVCFYLTTPISSQSNKNFKGEYQSGTVALYKSGSGSIDNITTGTTSTFLPKTKFEYSLPCPMPSDLTVAALSPHTATLTWNEGFLESAWEIMVNDDDQNLISVEGAPTYTLTGLDAETTYSVKVRAACGGDDGNSAWTDAVDFTTLVACPMPTRFRLSNLGQHTATLNWTPGRDETSWLLAWSTDSDFNPDEATPIEITGTPVCAFSDLTPETNYYVYLRGDCDEEGNSLWTDKFTFRTALYNPTLLNDDNPYYYDGFDEETLEWEMANGGNHWMQGRSTCVSAPYAMYLSVSHSFIIDLSIATKSYVYKTFELEGGKQYEVSFDWRCKPLHNSTDFFEFRIYPAGVIFEAGEYPTGASAILSRRLEGSNKYLWDDHYETFQIPEGEGGSYVVVFSWKSDQYGSGGYYYDNSAAFDNFLINVYQGEAPRPTPPQPEPTEVTLPMEVLEVTPLAWQIIYSTDPELDPYTLDLSEFPDSLPEGVVGFETTETAPTLQGLDPETGYYVYVRAIYPPVKKDEEERVFSRWSEQITFTTAVSCFPVEDLEATTVRADNATLAWNTDEQQPSANAPATWNVRYKKDVQAGAATTYTFNDGKNPAAYIENWSVKNGSLISAGYTENNCIGFEIQLPSVVSFDAEGISHDVNYEVKACYDPQGNSVMASMNGTAVDGVSQPATFDFSDYEGTCYLVFSMSFQAPLLIDNLTLDVPVWTTGTANSNTFTINGLESKTDYLFAVQAHCGEGDDSQWVPASFRTAYGNLAIPYEEDFDGYSMGDLPEGWYSIENGQFPIIMDDSEITPHSSENCLVLFGSDESDQYAILPPAENVSSLQMAFWSATPVSQFGQTTFTIGVMTDPEDVTTFEPVKTFTTTSDWTKNIVYFDQYEGQGQYIAIQLVGAVDTGKLLAIDDIEVSAAPSCFLPEALTVTDLTTSSAVVSWTPNGEETQWNICIKDMSSVEPDWGQPILVENTPSYTFDNLSLGTSYKVRVQAVCAVDDVSDWVETQFNTSFCEPENQCAITYTLEDEYGDGWNGASIDIMNGSTLVASLTIDGGRTYEGSLSLCPDVTYTFAWTSGEYDSECSFTIYDTEGTKLLHHDVYSEFEETTLLQYDMVCPSCITPSGLAVTEHTVSSAAFSWMASSGVSAWEYEYSSDNEHWSQTQVVEGTPSCVLEGLMPSSSYYFRVRANCGEDDYSKWATLEFNTDCGTINVDAEHPYSENFDAIKGWGYYDNAEHNILPRCWSYINTSENFYGYPSLFGEHPYYYNEGGEGGDGGYYEEGECNHSYSCPTYMRFVASNGACEQYAILPAMSNVNGLQLEFMVHNADFDLYNETVLHIGVMTDPTDASTYTEIQSYLLTIPVYEELCVYFDKYELQPNVDEYYIAFKVDVPEDGMYDIYIDNVSVTVLPSCLAPYELSVDNVGENDATLTWAPNGDETAWQVRYSSDKVNWTIVDYTEAEPGQTVTELLDNLAHNTLYYVQVRANCGGSYSDWSRQNKFRTDCSSGYQDVPFFEDFDSYIAFDDRMPQCWTYINASNSTQYPTNQSYPVISNGVEGYTANNYMYFLIKYYDYLNYHYGMDPQDQYVILPRMENIGNLQMKFSGLGEKNNYWTDYNCQVKVGVFDDNDAFHLIRTVETSRTGYFGNYLVTFDGYEGSGRIAFLVETPQQFGGRCYSSLVKIDNVSVTPKVSYKKFIADGNWSDASCWENGEMPTSASDNVLISAAAVIPSDCVAVCGIIEFDGNGASITIEDGGQLKHSNSGVHATMKKHIDPYTEGERDQWNLIAMPVVDEVYIYDVENINSGAYDLYYFDQTYEGAEWRNQENYETNWYYLTPKKGYLYANAEEVTLEVDGELFPANADQSVSLDYVEGKSRTGWNLIGNPFACQAYLANGMAYYRMNAGGTAIESAMAGTAIAPMEGVFVKASGSGQTAVFTTTQQRGDGHLNIRLSHNQGRAIDNAIMGFGEGGSLLKVQLMSNASKIYFTENDKDYSIISAGQIGEQPLNFTTSEDGNYTLTFSLAEVRLSYLHLIDNMTGADVDLLALRQAQGPATYTFSARSTDYESRFKLVFAANGDVDGDDDFAFFSNGNWVVVNEGEALVQVIDMNGRILSSETINGSAQVKVNAACGLYVMRLVNGEKVKTQKIVVQ